MHWTSLRRVALITVAGASVAAAATGITYAATSAGPTVRACANSHGTLRLLNSKGRCASGFSKVSINKQGRAGPRGATGKTGARGATGKTGPRGPGAISLVVDTTAPSAFRDSPVIGHTGLTVTVVCGTAGDADSAVYLTNGTTSSNYSVHGQYYYSADGSGTMAYTLTSGPTIANLATGAGLLDYQQNGVANTSSELVVRQGRLTADLIVTRGSETFTLVLYLNQATGHCQANAQVTPTR